MLRPNKIGVHFIEYRRQYNVFGTVYRSSVWYYWKESIAKNYGCYIEESYELADVVLLFVLSGDLAIDEFYNQLLELEIRKDKNKLLPIITLGNDSLKAIFENFRLNTNPKAKYLDHSRWNRYFNLKDILKSDSGFKKAIDFFVQNKSYEVSDKPIKYYHILKTNVALEYVELHRRVLENSRLEKFGGHANFVQPFVFHSETEMQNKYSKTESKKHSILDILKASKLKWRILLIDDHIGESNPLSPFDTREIETHGHLLKQKIVANLLEEDNWTVRINSSNGIYHESESEDIVIVPVSNIKDAVDELKKKTYDIILLDFLLGPSDTPSKDGKREFGHNLLEKIENENILKSVKNPLNYFWILIMSAFPQAFLDKLRERGLSHYSNHWHLARGADPINTPELFKYSLYKLMYLQVLEVDFDKKELIDHLQNSLTFESSDEVRNWAKSFYQIFISKFGKFHLVKHSRKRSLFSDSMYRFMTENRNEELILYEKVRNFLFLLANGTYDDSGQLIKSHEELLKEKNIWSLEERGEQNLKDRFNIILEYIYNLRR